MGRNLNQIIADLPPDRQARIDARYREMKAEVDGLRELRQVAGKAQADIATALNIKQPSVSKIEKQADMYLSNSTKLRRSDWRRTGSRNPFTQAPSVEAPASR